MITLALVWIALLVGLTLFIVRRPPDGGAITLAYFLSLSLLHVPGILPYLDANSPLGDGADTLLGFKITLVGMLAYVVGVMASRLIADRGSDNRWHDTAIDVAWVDHLSTRFLVGGVIAFLVLLPVAALVRSLTSIVSAWMGLLVVGVWLRLFAAAVTRNRRKLLSTIAVLPLLPLVTLVSGGFIGYGVQWVLSAICFLFITLRRRFWFIVLAPVAMFLGLSLFVTYMGERGAIRDAVWYEQADLADRIERVAAIATNFQLLDLDEPAHVLSIDSRLNQNFFVGVTATRYQSGEIELAYGDTVPWWVLIPRAIWPGKPEIGGGGRVVADATGIEFSETTSVGAGQVLEFFVNFGMIGVVVGFFALGFLLMYIDRTIMRSLALGDMRGFLVRALLGLALLQPGGNLVEVLISAIGAVFAAHLVVFVDRRLSFNAGGRNRQTLQSARGANVG